MTIIVRFLLRAASVLRYIPGTIYITLGTITLPLLALAATAWGPFTDLGSFVLITWGAVRSGRRYRALYGWTAWKP